MALIYSELSDIILHEDENMTDVRLNSSFNKLLENDRCLLQDGGNVPNLWECKWYNNESVPGYNIGDAVWINTQSIDDIVISKSEAIYKYALNNPYLADVIKPFDYSKETIELYKSIVSGYYDNRTNVTLSSLFYGGDVRECANILISKENNNKDYPTLSSGKWKKFIDSDVSQISNTISSISKYVFDQHVQNFHNNLSVKPEGLDDYANKQLNNITRFQYIKSQIQDIHESGFDYIINSEYNSTTISKTETKQELSNIIETKTLYWQLSNINDRGTYKAKDFEYFATKSDAEKYLKGAKNYNQLSIQHWIDKIYTTGSKEIICDVAFQVENGLAIDGYPTTVTMDKRSEIDDIISHYNISRFFICKKEGRLSDVVGMQEHYNFEEEYPLTSDSNKDNKYIEVQTSSTILSTIDVTQTTSYDIVSSWYVLWNSGYLEQGGYCQLTGNETTINLPKPYTYLGSDHNIYGNILSTSDGCEIDITNNLDEHNRYTIQITPVSENMTEVPNIESIKNDSFKVSLSSYSKLAIMYQTAGYVVKED